MNWEAIFDLARSVMLIVILIESIRLVGAGKNTVQTVLFTLAIASIVLSDFYWLAYDVLRPETRMPFAANEISEWSLFLLLGASLLSRGQKQRLIKIYQIIGIGWFVVANVALWLGWSGEWFQDIVTGVVLFYFLYALICNINSERAFAKRQWVLLSVVCIVLIAGEAGTFFVSGIFYTVLDLFCYALLFATGIAFCVKAFLSIRKDAPAQTVCNSFSTFAWSVIALYMSSGVFYLAAMVMSACSFWLMFLALKKEVDAE